MYFNNVFAADSFCLGKIFTGVVGVNHYLHNAAAVAQVNKNQSAVVASFGNPAAKHNFFFVVGFGKRAAIMIAFQITHTFAPLFVKLLLFHQQEFLFVYCLPYPLRLRHRVPARRRQK